ncbi:uncharacterized protein A4U43_C07F19450 [Asparagus officinalis]|uniref:C2 domain-containing protein n=1 Tax=Asparagus officinalis TaxID=4686 RepID=A0A5P1EF45_ASPOF|nr:uncharacterized protein A4U43_C07F19450 [Asparagus officinalis]
MAKDEKLVVEVIAAHNLMPKDGQGSSSPFVEVEFEHQKRRTRSKSKELNPIFNERLVLVQQQLSDSRRFSPTAAIALEESAVGRIGTAVVGGSCSGRVPLRAAVWIDKPLFLGGLGLDRESRFRFRSLLGASICELRALCLDAVEPARRRRYELGGIWCDGFMPDESRRTKAGRTAWLFDVAKIGAEVGSDPEPCRLCGADMTTPAVHWGWVRWLALLDHLLEHYTTPIVHTHGRFEMPNLGRKCPDSLIGRLNPDRGR